MNTAVTSHLTHGSLNATGVKLQSKQSQSVSIVKRQGTLATVSRTQAITIPKPVIKFSSGRMCLIYVCLNSDRCSCEQYISFILVQTCISSSLFVRRCHCKIRERRQCPKIMCNNLCTGGFSAGTNNGWKQFINVSICTFILTSSLCV